MKIICEYCGTQFNTDGVDVCPNCGASFENNSSMEQKVLQENKKTQLELEKKELELEQRRIETARNRSRLNFEKQGEQTAKIIKLGCAIPIICFAVFWVIFLIIGFGSAMKDEDTSRNHYYSSDVSSEVVETPVTVNFNEAGKTSKYSVICDSYQAIEIPYFKPAKGYRYVSFHLIVENTSDERLLLDESIDCLSDGIMCSSQWDTDRKTLPYAVNKGIKAEEITALRSLQMRKALI